MGWGVLPLPGKAFRASVGFYGRMKAPPVFKAGKTIRVVMIDDEPWFVAADVCKALYTRFNRYAGVSPWLRPVAQDERTTVSRKTPGISLALFQGAAPSYVLISESGLYKLIMRSDHCEAHQVRMVARSNVTCGHSSFPNRGAKCVIPSPTSGIPSWFATEIAAIPTSV